jgi:hypothetical protein
MNKRRQKKALAIVASLLGCGYHDPIVRQQSSYVLDVGQPLSKAQIYFEARFDHKFKRDFEDFVTIYFYEDQSEVNAICRSQVDVAGCIYAYWQFVILDHPDPVVRCQAILHEAGHMALMQITGDFDYEHKNAYFSEFVFDPVNC